MSTLILPDLLHEQRKIVDGGDVHIVRLDGHIRIDESTCVDFVGHGARVSELPQGISSGVHFTKASLVRLIEQSIHIGQFDLIVIVE